MNAKNRNRKKEASPPSLVPLSPGLNLVVRTGHLEVIATSVFQPPAIGLPIMREGFLTETGLLAWSELPPGNLVC